jgi:Fe-S cluster biogenesis protein NfuA
MMEAASEVRGADAGEEQAFRARMGELHALLERVQGIEDAAARETTSQILQALLEFHGAGMARIVERLNEAGETGRDVLEACGRDELVGSLLVLYGLHPTPLAERVGRAVEKLAPVLAPYGGTAELRGISEAGEVRVAYCGKAHGCGSTRGRIRETIEQGVFDGAPDVAGVEVVGLEAPAGKGEGFVPVEQVLAGIQRHAS